MDLFKNSMLKSNDFQLSKDANLDDSQNQATKLTYFIEQPSKNLYCPICNEIFKEPVLINCSHTFCSSCIVPNEDSIVSSDFMCPLDSQKCNIKLKNKIISDQIDELLVRCRYGIKITKEPASSIQNSSKYVNEKSYFKLTLDLNGCQSNIKYSQKK